MIVREFLTRLAFNADDRKVRKFDKAVRVLRRSLLAVVGAATAASAAAFKLAGDTAQYGDELAKTARRLGINVDALERLRFAAERSGVAQKTLEMSLQRMTRRLSEAAAGGGEAQKAIQELGLDAQALGNMNPEEAMNVLADALEGVENQSDRVRLAFKFFDSEGVALLNMLDGGSEKVRGLGDEFERLGGGLTGKQAAAAEAFTDAMTDMQTTFANLRLQIGAKLMPIFKPLIEQFTEFLVINRELILERIHRTFEILIGVMRSLMRIAGRVWSVVDDLAQAFGGWERTLELAGNAVKFIIGLSLVKWLTGAKNGISGLANLLSFGFVLRWGAWGALIAAAAVGMEDLSKWINDGESAIGKILGPFDDFKDSLGDTETLINAIIGLALAKWAWGVAGGMFAAALGVGAINKAMTVLANHPAMKVLMLLFGIDQNVNLDVQGGLKNQDSDDLKLDRKLGAEEGETFGEMVYRRLGLDKMFGGDGTNTESGDSVPDGAASGDSVPDGANTESDGLDQTTPPSTSSQRRNGSSATSGSGTNDTFMRRDQKVSGVIDQLSRFFGDSGPQMTPAMAGGGVTQNTSNVVKMNARIDVTVPPGSNNEQAEFIASRVRAEIEREVNHASTALEA